MDRNENGEDPFVVGIPANGIKVSVTPNPFGKFLAIALDSPGNALSKDTAIAWNLFANAFSGQVAIAMGRQGCADGILAIALGEGGSVVAREGGTIAIAIHRQQPGHWEFPHGCDQIWIEGDQVPFALKVSRVGENGIRPGFEYRLNQRGEFEEVREAKTPNPYLL